MRIKSQNFSRSHAPAWERILVAKASQSTSSQRRDAGASRLDSHAGAWEPEKRRDAGASRLDSHAGAWEPEKEGTLARPDWIPTPARGNQKFMFHRFHRWLFTFNPFRVGTSLKISNTEGVKRK